MIKSIDMKDNRQIEQKDEDIILKASPYMVRTNKFNSIIDALKNNPAKVHCEYIKDGDSKFEKIYFAIWRNMIKQKLYCGVLIIPNIEADRGIHINKYEPN